MSNSNNNNNSSPELSFSVAKILSCDQPQQEPAAAVRKAKRSSDRPQESPTIKKKKRLDPLNMSPLSSSASSHCSSPSSSHSPLLEDEEEEAQDETLELGKK